MLLFALGTFFTIMSNLFVIGEAEFFAHKQKMEKMYGPCEWKYVGKQPGSYCFGVSLAIRLITCRLIYVNRSVLY